MNKYESQTLHSMDVTDIQQAYENNDFTPSSLVDWYIQQIESNKALNVYLEVFHSQAKKSAKESDERYAQGKARLLEGVVFGIKDLFCTKMGHTTAGSKILQHYQSPIESTVTQRLMDHGAIVLGKVNLDEFGMGSANDNPYFGRTYNPWKGKKDKDYNRTPGGSSGGSSSAVAAHLCCASMGTDTGGSVRQPAAFTGIVGLKPTYGRVSRHGMIAFGSSFDSAGILSLSVRDSAKILQCIAGADPKDVMTANVKVPNYISHLQQPLKGLRIGVLQDKPYPGWEKTLDHVGQTMKDIGATVQMVSLKEENPDLDEHAALAIYYIIAISEASSNLMRYDGVRYGFRAESKNLEDMYIKTRLEGFGAEVQKRVTLGAYFTSSKFYDTYFEQAQKVRTLIIDAYKKIFQRFDVLLTPTTLRAAFEFSNMPSTVNMMESDLLTVGPSVTGYPALSIPVGLNDEGLPISIQFIGKPFDEATLLNVGHQCEKIYKRLICNQPEGLS